MFLSPDELVAFTGRRRPTDQRKELDRRGVRYEVNALGKPIVLAAYIESRMGGKPQVSNISGLNWQEMAKRGILRPNGPSQKARQTPS